MAAEKPHIIVVGLSHTSTPLAIREKFCLDQEGFGKAMQDLRVTFHIREFFLLSTCNRLEMALVTSRNLDADDVYVLFGLVVARATSCQDKDIDYLIKKYVNVRYQQAAISHLFAVCCGLDSLVVGETQIISQFKKAIDHAKVQGWLGSILGRLAQEALATNKRVRTQTDIGRKPVSVSHMAIDLAKQKAGDLSKKNVALIGAGEMIRLTAQYLLTENPKQLVIINRTLAHAEELVERIGYGQSLPYDQLTKAVAKSHVVICSTSSKEYIITHKMIEKIQSKRRRHLFLIDLSLPRNIEPTVGELPYVHRFDIDDIKQIVESHRQDRQLEADKGYWIVIDRSQSFMKWLNLLAYGPVIADFRSYLDTLFTNELQRALKKQCMQALDHNQLETFDVMLNSIKQKLAGDAALRLNRSRHGIRSEQLAIALKELFMLAPDENNQESTSP